MLGILEMYKNEQVVCRFYSLLLNVIFARYWKNYQNGGLGLILRLAYAVLDVLQLGIAT